MRKGRSSGNLKNESTRISGEGSLIGLSLAGNGTKKIEIKNVVDSGTAHASMSGWLFTT